MVPGALCFSFPQCYMIAWKNGYEFWRIWRRQNPSSNCRGWLLRCELACKLADRLGERGRLRLIELSDQILRTSPEFNPQQLIKLLEARGVWIDLETKVEAGPDAIALEYKNQVDTIPVCGDLDGGNAGGFRSAYAPQAKKPTVN